MYNRYIQQADGSFRKSRIASPGTFTSAEVSSVETLTDSPPRTNPDHPEPEQPLREPPVAIPPEHTSQANIKGENLSSFLHQLLPKDFDTGDLIVVLLLLLLSENGKESSNTSLLTLVIYLFL